MLQQVLAATLVLVVVLTYIGMVLNSYEAYKEWGIGKKGWLKRNSLSFPPLRSDERWQKYEEAVKNYYAAVGAVKCLIQIVILVIAYYLWNA
jgi:hypothetical protein